MQKTVIIAALLLVLSCLALADDGIGLTFYRGVNGEVSQASFDNAKAMRDFAKSNGHIDVWLTLNYNYNLYPEHMTTEELAIQSAEVKAGLDEILNPLIANGDAKHPKAGPFIRGPACAVRLTKRGLKKVLKEQRLIQVVAMRTGSG